MTPKYDHIREQFCKAYPDATQEQIFEQFGFDIKKAYYLAKKWGLKKSAAFFEAGHGQRFKKGQRSNPAHEFKKGQAPPNKGVPMSKWCPPEKIEAIKKNQFKKGQASHNEKPLGSTRVDKVNFAMIKTEKGYYHLHRLIWEQHYGPIPSGMMIRFKDKNRKNFDINNLEMVSKVDNMLKNSIQNYPPAIKDSLKLIKKLNKIIYEKQN